MALNTISNAIEFNACIGTITCSIVIIKLKDKEASYESCIDYDRKSTKGKNG